MSRSFVRGAIVVLAVIVLIGGLAIWVFDLGGDADAAVECSTEQLHEFPTFTTVEVDAIDAIDVIDAEQPTGVAGRPGEGSLLVAERAGQVLLVDTDGSSEVVLDLTDEIITDGERGLLDIEVGPGGDRLYVHYTDLQGDTVVAWFELDDELRPDEASHTTVIEIPQPRRIHNGGRLRFDGDGVLLIGLGDSGMHLAPSEVQVDAEDASGLLGSVLRIDPESEEGGGYAVPADNPWVGVEGVRDEIFFEGVRNVWRFDVDPDTGDVWVADVGHFCWESVTYLPAAEAAGADLGWPGAEGVHAFHADGPLDDVSWPIYVYPRVRADHQEPAPGPDAPNGCAVIGGAVYRGEALAGLDGAFVFSDFCTGVVSALTVDGDGEVSLAELIELDEQALAVERAPDGEILVLTSIGVRRLEAATTAGGA